MARATGKGPPRQKGALKVEPSHGYRVVVEPKSGKWDVVVPERSVRDPLMTHEIPGVEGVTVRWMSDREGRLSISYLLPAARIKSPSALSRALSSVVSSKELETWSFGPEPVSTKVQEEFKQQVGEATKAEKKRLVPESEVSIFTTGEVDAALADFDPQETVDWKTLLGIYRGLSFYVFDPRYETFRGLVGGAVLGEVGILASYPHRFRSGRTGAISKTFPGHVMIGRRPSGKKAGEPFVANFAIETRSTALH